MRVQLCPRISLGLLLLTWLLSFRHTDDQMLLDRVIHKLLHSTQGELYTPHVIVQNGRSQKLCRDFSSGTMGDCSASLVNSSFHLKRVSQRLLFTCKNVIHWFSSGTIGKRESCRLPQSLIVCSIPFPVWLSSNADTMDLRGISEGIFTMLRPASSDRPGKTGTAYVSIGAGLGFRC